MNRNICCEEAGDLTRIGDVEYAINKIDYDELGGYTWLTHDEFTNNGVDIRLITEHIDSTKSRIHNALETQLFSPDLFRKDRFNRSMNTITNLAFGDIDDYEIESHDECILFNGWQYPLLYTIIKLSNNEHTYIIATVFNRDFPELTTNSGYLRVGVLMKKNIVVQLLH